MKRPDHWLILLKPNSEPPSNHLSTAVERARTAATSGSPSRYSAMEKPISASGKMRFISGTISDQRAANFSGSLPKYGSLPSSKPITWSWKPLSTIHWTISRIFSLTAAMSSVRVNGM